MVVWSLYEDLDFGKFNEKKVLYYLNKNKYQDNFLKMYKNEKNEVDFKNDYEISELKSRQNKKDKYPTTFFGNNKLIHIDNLKKDKERIYKFYFLFTDGLYSWDYNEDSKYEIKDFYHREKGRNVDMVHIKVQDLNLITNDITSLSSLPSDYQLYL